MKPTYLETWYRLDGQVAGLLSIVSDMDGVVVDSNGSVLSFTTRVALLAYAAEIGVNLLASEDDPITLAIDLDKVGDRSLDIECQTFSDAWNLFTDVAASVGELFDVHHPESNRLYDKLFWGCNLPSVTPAGKWYSPIWSAEELTQLHALMSVGLNIFRSSVKFRV